MHRPCKEEYLRQEDHYRSSAVIGMDGHCGQRDERHRERSLLGSVSLEGSLCLSLRPWEVDGGFQWRV